MALQKIRLEKSITEASRKIVLTAGLIAVLFPVLWLLKTSFIENQETIIKTSSKNEAKMKPKVVQKTKKNN